MMQKGLVLVLADAFRCGGMGWVATSTFTGFSPVGSRSSNGMRMCVCVCMCVWTEWTWSMHYFGISTDQFIPCYASVIHTHTCILKPFEDSEPTGLKVDIAGWVVTWGATHTHPRRHTHAHTHTHTHTHDIHTQTHICIQWRLFFFLFFSLFDFR